MVKNMGKECSCNELDGLDVRLCDDDEWLIAEIKPKKYKKALEGCYENKKQAEKDFRNVYSDNKLAKVMTQKDFDELKLKEIALK